MLKRAVSRLSDEEETVAAEVISCALAVHRDVGPGYLEALYQNALCIELGARSVAYELQRVINVTYRGRPIGTHRVDLIVQGLVIVELKAVEALVPAHRRQVVSYLKASKLRLGLLINFSEELLKHGVKRVVL
jgi:GxxExxY protein